MNDQERVAALSNREPDPEQPTHVPVEAHCGCGRVLDRGGTCPYILSALKYHTYAGTPPAPPTD